MAVYISRRCLLLIPMILGASVIVFAMFCIAPGAPAVGMSAGGATDESFMPPSEKSGIEEPIYIRYGIFIHRLLEWDGGWADFYRRAAATIEISAAAWGIAVLIGGILGIVSARQEHSSLDSIITHLFWVGASAPVFWVGLLLVLVFSHRFGGFPISGRIGAGVDLNLLTHFYIPDAVITRNWSALKDILWHMILPAATLGLIPMAIVYRTIRSGLLNALKQDYIKTARAKGLSEDKVIFSHGIRNALIPAIPTIKRQCGVLIGGVILTETIFDWPGLGQWFYHAIIQRNPWNILSGVFYFSLGYMILDTIVDILHYAIYPGINET